MYMQQRYYDPQIGRFLSIDPVEAHSGGSMYFNRYRYAAGNPYKFIDPDGRRNGRANPNPSHMSLTRPQREKLAGIIAKKYGIDTGGRGIHAFDGGAGAQPTAQGFRIWEGQFVSESMLAATLGHEFEKHYDEHIKNNGYGENWGDEVDAYEYNLENAGRFGTLRMRFRGSRIRSIPTRSASGRGRTSRGLRSLREIPKIGSVQNE